MIARLAILWLAALPLAHAASSKLDFWKSAPRGVNVLSTIQDSDLEAAARFGVRLVRVGATGSPGDLRFLVRQDPSGEHWDLRPENLERLRDFARRARAQGLSVVFTLAHLPGRRWEFRQKDLRLWSDQGLQTAFVDAWRAIAHALRDEPNVVGYDLINEPYLALPENPEDPAPLRALYLRTWRAIRDEDPETLVILESPTMASAASFGALEPLPDEHVIYSFHTYEPFPYFSPPLNRGRWIYPGSIPPTEGAPLRHWDRAELDRQFAPVLTWQTRFQIPGYRVFVGEFGVWRKARGAHRYLSDLLGLFHTHGWSWTYYAFREEGWDVPDLEWDEILAQRRSTSLFRSLKTHFQ